jgi:tRNA (cmo5U34)-methyltransferase
MKSVGQFFDALTNDYTVTIERCFPRYREMLWALLEYLPDDHACSSILELGCGTGNLSILLAEAFPCSVIRLVDISRESIDACRTRLGDGPRFAYEQRDFRKLDCETATFDLIVSSISIHHLTSTEKIELFNRLHAWLKPHGVFAYADQFRGATEDLYSCHIKNWKEQSIAAGASEDEFEMWMAHQREHDHHDTLKDQLDWLSATDFAVVDCPWRYLLWSVVQARKP